MYISDRIGKHFQLVFICSFHIFSPSHHFGDRQDEDLTSVPEVFLRKSGHINHYKEIRELPWKLGEGNRKKEWEAFQSATLQQICMRFSEGAGEEGKKNIFLIVVLLQSLNFFNLEWITIEKSRSWCCLHLWIAGTIHAKTGRRISEAGTQAEMAAMAGACSTVDRGQLWQRNLLCSCTLD